ncbi:hypothetical protein [Desulforhabdus amnigena]|uniref:Uncharacterized protein n=1 Tax=Desulforhabdus amnigena TaxID=40218 RepID=A0A9W6FW95_9BACT|nr:hypothetical protein [Desulforhabdus amnigena]GLI35978.1 hypothetical protein DAMNIGENAA_34110 [Desulforhabdus amnigena]
MDMNLIRLSLLVMGLGLFFYLEENISEKPNILRAAIFVSAIVEGCLCMAFRLS